MELSTAVNNLPYFCLYQLTIFNMRDIFCTDLRNIHQTFSAGLVLNGREDNDSNSCTLQVVLCTVFGHEHDCVSFVDHFG